MKIRPKIYFYFSILITNRSYLGKWSWSWWLLLVRALSKSIAIDRVNLIIKLFCYNFTAHLNVDTRAYNKYNCSCLVRHIPHAHDVTIMQRDDHFININLSDDKVAIHNKPYIHKHILKGSRSLDRDTYIHKYAQKNIRQLSWIIYLQLAICRRLAKCVCCAIESLFVRVRVYILQFNLFDTPWTFMSSKRNIYHRTLWAKCISAIILLYRARCFLSNCLWCAVRLKLFKL